MLVRSLNLLHDVLGTMKHILCFYTSACSMRNKQKKLEALAVSQSYSITGIRKLGGKSPET